jgi:hypothetical protein
MSMFEVLIIVIAGGIVGGLASLFIRLEFVSKSFKIGEELVNSWSLIYLAFFDGFIGAAGALGVQFIIISVNSFPEKFELKNKLFLLTVSVIAGFGARHLLPTISDRLKRDINEVKRESGEAKRESDEAKRESIEAREEAKEAARISKIREALRPDAPPSEVLWGITQLSQDTKAHPTDRTAAILLGRLHRKERKLGKAIQVLDNFVEAFVEAKENVGERDVDYADALYNRACYKSLLWKETHETPYKEGALQDLALAIQFSQANKVDARDDPDFASVHEDPRFNALVGMDEV